MIALVALTAFTLNGITFKEGDTLDVRPLEAAMLTHRKKAEFASKYQVAAQVAETPKRRRRAYKRRDLVAET